MDPDVPREYFQYVTTLSSELPSGQPITLYQARHQLVMQSKKKCVASSKVITYKSFMKFFLLDQVRQALPGVQSHVRPRLQRQMDQGSLMATANATGDLAGSHTKKRALGKRNAYRVRNFWPLFPFKRFTRAQFLSGVNPAFFLGRGRGGEKFGSTFSFFSLSLLCPGS